MGWVDLIPRAGKLYIGGLYALYQTELIKEANITHVVSVVNFDSYEAEQFRRFTHLAVQVEDDPNENLLEHFGETNRFIAEGLATGGGVFVHCAMGKSRSATIVIAYLMDTYRVSPAEALAQVCEGRPVCGPNLGFMEQLDVYHRMLGAENEDGADGIYREWLGDRFVGASWEWERRAKL